MHNSLQILSGFAYGTKSYWIFCEVWTLSTSWHSLSPTKHFIQAAWIFPLCPSGHVLSLISPKTTLKYSCNAHCIHTCICLLYNADQQLALDEAYKNGCVCEHVSERFGFVVETRGLTCCKIVGCVSEHVFFFLLCLQYVYWFCFKVKKNSLYLQCVACWTQQKYNENTV